MIPDKKAIIISYLKKKKHVDNFRFYPHHSRCLIVIGITCANSISVPILSRTYIVCEQPIDWMRDWPIRFKGIAWNMAPWKLHQYNLRMVGKIIYVTCHTTTQVHVLPLRSGASCLLANGSAAFKWKLHCHRLIDLSQRQIALAIRSPELSPISCDIGCYKHANKIIYYNWCTFEIDR